MTDKRLAESSASNAALGFQSVEIKKYIESEKVSHYQLQLSLDSEKVIRHQLELTMNKLESTVRQTESAFETFCSELDGLREENKELRMELKLEKESHKVEKEGPVAVTLRSSAIKMEPVVKESPPILNTCNRKKMR